MHKTSVTAHGVPGVPPRWGPSWAPQRDLPHPGRQPVGAPHPTPRCDKHDALVKNAGPEQAAMEKALTPRAGDRVRDGAGSAKDALKPAAAGGWAGTGPWAGGCFSVTSCPVSALRLGVRR